MPRTLLPLVLLTLPLGASAQELTFEADCLPGGSVTFDLSTPVQVLDAGNFAIYDLGAGISLTVWDNTGFEQVGIGDANTGYGVTLTGTGGILDSTAPPTSLTLSDWNPFPDTAALTPGDECPLLAITTGEEESSFVIETISGTPGFGTVIDSGPGRFDSGLIEDRMQALEAEADALGCTSTEWAGTWVRHRDPRVSGLTSAGEVVSGAAITDGDVNGTPFSASLDSGGALTGSTADGSTLHGYFARLSSKRSIWYAVEMDCDAL